MQPVCIGRTVVVALLAAVAGVGCGAFVTEKASRRGPLQVVPPIVDFGSTKDRRIEREVTLTNESASRLRIVGVDHTCSCTLTGLTIPHELLPGTSVRVPIRLTYPEKQKGAVSVSVTLRTDDKEFAQYRVPIVGVLEGETTVTTIPDALRFGRIGGWEEVVKELKICPSDGADCAIKEVSSLGLKTRFVRRLEDGCYLYEVNASPAAQVGRFDEIIKIDATCGQVAVAVTGERMGPVFITPAVISCGTDSVECTKDLTLVHSPETVPRSVSANCDVADVVGTEIVSTLEGQTRIRVKLRFAKSHTDATGTLKVWNSLTPEDPLLVKVHASS